MLAPTAADIAAGTAEKVWTLADLQILHQLQSPVFVVAFGMDNAAHR